MPSGHGPIITNGDEDEALPSTLEASDMAAAAGIFDQSNVSSRKAPDLSIAGSYSTMPFGATASYLSGAVCHSMTLNSAGKAKRLSLAQISSNSWPCAEWSRSDAHG
jgi:hypothetical protein